MDAMGYHILVLFSRVGKHQILRLELGGELKTQNKIETALASKHVQSIRYNLDPNPPPTRSGTFKGLG